MPEIIFYDVASNEPGLRWSPNTLRTRFTLNYKCIPYKTECLEFPDIARKCKEMGIAPTSIKPDGSDIYTLPAIWDPLTKTGLSGSYHIAKYLDETYPETPRVLFEGIEVYDQIINGSPSVLESPITLFVYPYVPRLLNPVSQEYYRRTREEWVGKKWEDILPTGKEKEELWKAVKEEFNAIDLFLKENEQPSAGNGQLSYVDIVFGAKFYALRLIWGEENEFWQDMSTWSDGRWLKYAEKIEKYIKPLDGDS